MKHRILLPLLTAAGALSAHGALIAYDPFSTTDNYSVTAGGDSLGRLPNQTGLTNTTGTGLAATWTTVSGSTSNYLYRAAGSLSYTGLATTGNGGIQFTPGDDTFRDARRDTLTTIPTAGVSSLYMSFLLRTPATTVDANGTASVFFRANTANSTGFGAGIANGNLAMQWRDSGGGLNYLSLGTAYTANTTYLFVVKAFENSADWFDSDSQTVWVNPTNFSSDATLTSSSLATLTKNDTFGVANSTATGAVSFMTQNMSGAGVMFVDEIRVGDTLSSVLVPEPSAALLGGLGMLALLRRRRA